jgi:hypothetical protein
MHQHIPKLIRLLDSLISMAEDESISGALSGGAEVAVRRYNAIVETLNDEDVIPDGLFSPLPSDTNFASLGVEAKFLRSYLDEPEDGGRASRYRADSQDHNLEFLAGIAPFAPREDLSIAVQNLIKQGGRVNFGLITALAPFLDQAEVGRLLRSQTAPRPPEPPTAPEPPAPPAEAPPKESSVVFATVNTSDLVPMVDVGNELARLGSELMNVDLSPQRRAEVMAEITKLAHQQAIRAEIPDVTN